MIEAFYLERRPHAGKSGARYTALLHGAGERAERVMRGVECPPCRDDTAAPAADKKKVVQCLCKFSRDKRFEGLPDRLSPRVLAGLDREKLKVVLSLARHQRFSAPSVIVRQGDAANRIFLLTCGQGAHFVTTGAGRKIVLHWLTAGQIFGGAAMLARPSHYLASTEVQTASCALVWNRQSFRELVSQFPVLLDNALSIAVTEHVAYQMAARISITTEDAPGRIARLLISLACGIGKDGHEGTEILVVNEDIAAGTSLTIFTVSRILAEWQRDGIVKKGRGKIILRSPGLLLRSV